MDFAQICLLVVAFGTLFYVVASLMVNREARGPKYRIVTPRHGYDARMGYSYRGRVEPTHDQKSWYGIIDRRLRGVWDQCDFKRFDTEQEAREWVTNYLDVKDWSPDPETFVR